MQALRYVFLYMLGDKNKHHYNDLIEHSSLWWSELKEQQQQFQESMCACFIYIREIIFWTFLFFIFVNIFLMSNATEVKAQWIESVDFVFIKKKKNTISLFFFYLPQLNMKREEEGCVFVI